VDDKTVVLATIDTDDHVLSGDVPTSKDKDVHNIFCLAAQLFELTQETQEAIGIPNVSAHA
jgi:hypothetical protein